MIAEEAIKRIAEKIAAAPDVTCPRCGEKISCEVASQLMDSSRMSFTITPHEGELINAKTVGGTIENVATLLSSVGKAMGIKTEVAVSGLRYEGGAITIELLLTRFEQGIEKRKAKVA